MRWNRLLLKVHIAIVGALLMCCAQGIWWEYHEELDEGGIRTTNGLAANQEELNDALRYLDRGVIRVQYPDGRRMETRRVGEYAKYTNWAKPDQLESVLTEFHYRLDGPAEYFGANGAIVASGLYLKGEKDGPWLEEIDGRLVTNLYTAGHPVEGVFFLFPESGPSFVRFVDGIPVSTNTTSSPNR